MTPTSKIVSQMKFEPPLSYSKYHALTQISYIGSTKVFMKFKKPFWSDYHPESLVPPISYYSAINGAVGISDDILSQV